MNKKIVLIYGLPGSGKTTLAKALYELMAERCIWFNADKVRSTLSSDLTFSVDARSEQARRMGCLASLSLDGSQKIEFAIVDFVNPTVQTFKAFLVNTRKPKGEYLNDSIRVPDSFLNEVEYPVYSVFMNTIEKKDSRYADTNALFEAGSELGLEANKPSRIVKQFLQTEKEFKELAKEILRDLEA